MARYRSVLSLVLAAIATFVVGCGSANQAQPPSYTPERLEQIETYTPRVISLRERFPELGDYIQQKDWINLQSFIHGPLGELRTRLNWLASQLIPPERERAQELAQEVFRHLERVDLAADERNQVQANQEYRHALDDFDAFIELLPNQAG
ncbi:photosystem II protein PsbQ [Halomicronema hongdechloris C2206]|uniref:Photosystem II protein PsbQ n=1 Tax=Halomicronema hongdechloris C2206 TaxID=1641165 RepID=A0A1Z3HRM6_9CYAN|nr:photosystem II protein PsbQ [Halomicronema hongdechloris]ASC72906.1 photosystem II protein PsbQ [Halomicronema hongdechloris C2206]